MMQLQCALAAAFRCTEADEKKSERARKKESGDWNLAAAKDKSRGRATAKKLTG